MTLTSARATLAAHQTKIIAAAATVQTARLPVLELQDRIDAAGANLRAAESAAAALEEAERNDVLDCGRNGKPANFVNKIAAASAEIARCQRALAALEARMVEVERPLDDATLSASVLASATEPLVANVIAEEADGVLAEFATAQVTAAVAEAKVRTLVAHIVSKKWLGLAEKISVKLNMTPPATWTTQSFPDWRALTTALVSDANAVPPVVS